MRQLRPPAGCTTACAWWWRCSHQEPADRLAPGERFFMQHLIDGDLAANNGGWQWSASTGTDAAPYFRIFNPISQSRSSTRTAASSATWVPELAGLNKRDIMILTAIGGLFGVAGYPRPSSTWPARANALQPSRTCLPGDGPCLISCVDFAPALRRARRRQPAAAGRAVQPRRGVPRPAAPDQRPANDAPVLRRAVRQRRNCASTSMASTRPATAAATCAGP